jgi:hypothetical protein
MQGLDGDAAALQWLKKNYNPSIWAQTVEATNAKRRRPQFKPLVAREDSDGEDDQQMGEEDTDDKAQAASDEEDELSGLDYGLDKKGGLGESDEDENDDLEDEGGDGVNVT